ncbi:adenylate kinase, partial [Streptococcus danieliae]|nr:adenylate kinase [Streptococcus danieliae]
AQGQPIIEHYAAKDMVFDIQGDQEIEQVFADIQAAVEKIK